MDEEFGLETPRGFVFGGGAGGEEGVNLVDEDDGGGEFLCDGKECADEFFRVS